MWRSYMVILVALCVSPGCAQKDGASPDELPMDLDSFKSCFEHVLSVSPDYMGGSEQFAQHLSGLSNIKVDHSECDGVRVENGVIKLSNGEPVEIIRLKSDFRCPCRSVWFPYFMLNAGEGQSITVQHPATPKSCEEICSQE